MKILFVCVENACRSQIAEGWAKRLRPEWESYSCSSEPADGVNPLAVKVMKEAGIDISGNKPKGYGGVPDQVYDLMVSMGCKDRCPSYKSKQFLEWDIPDPQGKDIMFMRNIREMIREMIKEKVLGV